MRDHLVLLVIMALFALSTAGADEPLPRGETVIHVPAVQDGLYLHSLFQSGMVLQREKPIIVWGWAEPGEDVTVSFAGQTQSAVTAADGSWTVSLTAQPANAEGQVLTVTGRERSIQLDDILIGDIWMLGGQSNMEFPLAKLVDGDLEIASANFSKIRHITIPQLDGPDAKTNFPVQHKWIGWFNRHEKQGAWEVCTPETARELSGLGYAFARRLHMTTQVPIGVIDLSRGGTTVETWTPRAVLDEIDTPEVQSLLQEWDEKVTSYDPQADLQQRVERHHQWVAKMKEQGKEADRPVPSDLQPGPAMDQNRPGNCFASMVSPIAGFPVKGAIFHQGYNNALGSGTQGAKMYAQVFPRMIAAWRENAGDPQMPFGIISLCTGGEPQGSDDYLAHMVDDGIYIREVQYQTYVDMVAAGDTSIGFASSFDQRRSWYHPQIKIPVGERMARWALATQYGVRLKWEPPTLVDMTAVDGTLVLKFNTWVGPHNDGPIVGFAIAGSDGRFQPARAEYLVTGVDGRNRPKVDRGTLVLSSPLVPDPVHFRHAWGRNPQSNLKADGIPFATQRSDDWTLEQTYRAYLGKPSTDAQNLDRVERRDLRQALQAADLDRRLYEARELIRDNQQAATE